jgi:hypothetical protein
MEVSSIYASINIVNPFLEIALFDFKQSDKPVRECHTICRGYSRQCRTNKIYVSDNENSRLYEIDG